MPEMMNMLLFVVELACRLPEALLLVQQVPAEIPTMRLQSGQQF